MAERYQIEFTEGGVGLAETLVTGGLAPIVEKAMDAISCDDNHGWYCTITDKVTKLKESQWGVTKEEAQERTFYALKHKIENYEEEQRREKEEAEEAEHQRRIQRQRQSVSQSSGGSGEDVLFQFMAKIVGYILVVAAILWLFLAVAVPLILINIATITLIAGLTKSKWRKFFFSVSILGTILVVVDYNLSWFTKALVSNVSFFEGLIPLFFYLNITTGLVAAYFLIRDYLNHKSEPAEGAGEFSKRNLIVMGCLLLVGGITVGLQKYTDSQNLNEVQLDSNNSGNTNLGNPNAEQNAKNFRGAWFEIWIPPNFKVIPSLKSATSSEGHESVFFRSQDNKVEFYIFSPQWNGEPTDIAVNPSIEKQVASESKPYGNNIVTYYTIKAIDGSYTRSYQDTRAKDESTRWVVGIKYSDQNAYNTYKNEYLKFKKSLQQFGD